MVILGLIGSALGMAIGYLLDATTAQIAIMGVQWFTVAYLVGLEDGIKRLLRKEGPK